MGTTNFALKGRLDLFFSSTSTQRQRYLRQVTVIIDEDAPIDRFLSGLQAFECLEKLHVIVDYIPHVSGLGGLEALMYCKPVCLREITSKTSKPGLE